VSLCNCTLYSSSRSSLYESYPRVTEPWTSLLRHAVMKTVFVLSVFYYLSFTNGFGSGLSTTTVKKGLSPTCLMAKGTERKRPSPSSSDLLSLPRKSAKKHLDHVLTNTYLNSINKPSLRSLWYAYWKKLQARGLAKLLANSLMAYLFIGSTSRCIVFSCAWFLSSKQVRFSFSCMNHGLGFPR
jgi:hypothetical protein